MADEAAILQATAAEVAKDGSTYVVLRWEAVDDVVGYNLYRSVEGEPPSESQPINGSTPISPPTSGKRLRELVAEDSSEWRALSRAHDIGAASGPGASGLTDPAALERGLNPDSLRLVRAAAQANLAMGQVAGLAYTDREVKAEVRYLYELRGVRKDLTEFQLAVDVPIWAGHFILPDPPSGIAIQAGDRRALVLWNRNPYAATYIVQRGASAGGPFQRVNPKPVAYDVEAGLDGLPLPAPQPGFLDIGAWDANGGPTSHLVEGVSVAGPDNGSKYWYRVASRDTLDRAGPWSAAVDGTPVRSLSPMAPDELQVSPTTSADGLVVTWRKVTRNVENHQLPDISQTNYVYRAETRAALEDLITLPTHLVATITSANPQDVTTPLVSWVDTDPALVPPYGTKPFFYRVRVADPFNNLSAPSAVISGTVPDTRAPGPTALTGASGAVDHIRVEWKPNTEPDLAGYQIYRGVCDRGFIFVPGITHDVNKEGQVTTGGESRFRCDMTLVGDVPLAEANKLWALDGSIWFDDFSVPEDSPLCYGYWVRGYDLSGNLYDGKNGCPRPGEYLCARLREETPPPAPVMTGLRARNKGVLVEWVGSPVQDLHAFHVYRSDAELDPPRFLACVFTDGTVSATPWKGLMPSCADVPAVPDPLAARGSYLDATADPHHVYWYRVSALDWLGNESDGSAIEDIPSSSTFAYTSDLPVTPAVQPPTAPVGVGCGLDITWGPTFDPVSLQGFVVFRAATGDAYRQVSGIIAANSFTDATARRGVDYLYCVQSIDLIGMLSQPSLPVLHRY